MFEGAPTPSLLPTVQRRIYGCRLAQETKASLMAGSLRSVTAVITRTPKLLGHSGASLSALVIFVDTQAHLHFALGFSNTSSHLH